MYDDQVKARGRGDASGMIDADRRADVDEVSHETTADRSVKVDRPRASRRILGIVAAVCAVLALGYLGRDSLSSFSAKSASDAETLDAKAKSKSKVATTFFKPSETQWRSLGIESVVPMTFRSKLATDGKIAINEDSTTPVFSPYAGRVTKLFAKPGDQIEKGAALFVVEASDMVQGQNDFLAAKTTLNKAKSQLAVADIVLKRHRELIVSNAVAKRDLEQAEIGQVTAANDLKTAEVALEAARNRLRILGKTDAEITAFEEGKSKISAETTVMAPLAGTVVQRKVGPGQFVAGASNDPVFVVGDLRSVWIVANVRESDATKVQVGQPIEFTILAAPDRVFAGKVAYISSSVNSDLRRLQVRADIANADGVLRPEMFANVAIVTSEQQASPAVPRHAVIYEGDEARVWVVRPDKSIEMRRIKTGNIEGNFVQVLSGLEAGDSIIGRGSLFIDRLAPQGDDKN